MNSDVSSHPWRPRLPGVLLVLCPGFAAHDRLFALVAARSTAAPPPAYNGFSNPQQVTIRNYEGDAMQPFITPDGVFLLFNNRSDPREDTRLHIAERIDDLTFHYLGELAGINSAGLDAAASVDNTNTLYFVSARNFGKTDETIYQSHFDAGVVSRIEPVSGISEHIPGRISFDAAVSSDGNVLLLVDGRFGKSNLPTEAEISMAIRTETGFQRTSTSQRMLGSINAPNALNYAPVLSTDLKELFFTPTDPWWTQRRARDPESLSRVAGCSLRPTTTCGIHRRVR
jgi:hypothetical protein